MKPSDYLRKGWTQGEAARLADGSDCATTDINAACWCIDGAAHVACGSRYTEFYDYAESIAGEILYEWNDAPGRTQQEVIELAERVESELGIT